MAARFRPPPKERCHETPRRWFQFSLRFFLVALTVLAFWLGVVVTRAREQREAVKAIRSRSSVFGRRPGGVMPLPLAEVDVLRDCSDVHRQTRGGAARAKSRRIFCLQRLKSDSLMAWKSRRFNSG